MTSSPSFRRELPTSKVTGGISMGLNSPRPEGTLSSMLSHLTLQIAGMHGAICNPTLFHSVSQWTETLSAPDTKYSLSSPSRMGLPVKRVKSIRANFREGPVLRLLIDDPYGAFVNVEFRNNSLRYGMLSVLPMIQHSIS